MQMFIQLNYADAVFQCRFAGLSDWQVSAMEKY